MIPICPCTHRVLDIGEKNTGSRSGRARVGPGPRFFTFLGSGPKKTCARSSLPINVSANDVNQKSSKSKMESVGIFDDRSPVPVPSLAEVELETGSKILY